MLATTNRNLRQEVTQGRFREDLFYRLNVLPLVLPPLRERPADIPPLVERTLRRYHGGAERVTEISEGALQRLQDYSWPGNVRELENLVQRAQVLAGNDHLDIEHLLFENEPEVEKVVEDSPSSLEADLKAREREIIFEALKSGNREAAAARLGISQRTLRHKLAPSAGRRGPDTG